MTHADARKLLAAVRAARRFVAGNRRTVIECSSVPPGSFNPENVTDEAALEWIAEHDALLSKLDAAIAKATA